MGKAAIKKTGLSDLLLSSAHLLNEDLGDIAVVVEGSQMQRREAVVLLNVHQLPRSAQDLLCGPATRTNDTILN